MQSNPLVHYDVSNQLAIDLGVNDSSLSNRSAVGDALFHGHESSSDCGMRIASQ